LAEIQSTFLVYYRTTIAYNLLSALPTIGQSTTPILSDLVLDLKSVFPENVK